MPAEIAADAGIPFLGNGDVRTREDAHQKAQDYDLDGVLIGRASFGNPYVFRRDDLPELSEADANRRTAHNYRILEIARDILDSMRSVFRIFLDTVSIRCASI